MAKRRAAMFDRRSREERAEPAEDTLRANMPTRTAVGMPRDFATTQSAMLPVPRSLLPVYSLLTASR